MPDGMDDYFEGLVCDIHDPLYDHAAYMDALRWMAHEASKAEGRCEMLREQIDKYDPPPPKRVKLPKDFECPF